MTEKLYCNHKIRCYSCLGNYVTEGFNCAVKLLIQYVQPDQAKVPFQKNHSG